MAEAQAAAEQPQEQQEEKKPSKTYSQEEVDRIADKVRRNARRDAELRFRRESQPQPRQEERKDEPQEEAEPQRDKFESYEEFADAKAAYVGRKAAREENAKLKKEESDRKAQEANQKAADAWKAKIEKAVAKHPDFEDVVEDNPETMELIANSPMRGFITQSEIGPEITRHLLLNKDEAKRIAALPAYKQAAAIDKIETELLAEGKPAKDEGEEKEEDEEKGDGQDEEKADGKSDEDKEDPERNADGTFKGAQKKKDPPPPINPGSGRSASNSHLPSDKDDAETWRKKEWARLERKKQGK